LGIEGADATGSRAGAAITAIEPGSPADEAGLTTDDVVTEVDGSGVSSMIDLAAAIRTRQPGDELVLTVVRDGAEREVRVVLGAAQSN
jgi:S1-C subfamily serine protease